MNTRVSDPGVAGRVQHTAVGGVAVTGHYCVSVCVRCPEAVTNIYSASPSCREEEICPVREGERNKASVRQRRKKLRAKIK